MSAFLRLHQGRVNCAQPYFETGGIVQKKTRQSRYFSFSGQDPWQCKFQPQIRLRQQIWIHKGTKWRQSSKSGSATERNQSIFCRGPLEVRDSKNSMDHPSSLCRSKYCWNQEDNESSISLKQTASPSPSKKSDHLGKYALSPWSTEGCCQPYYAP